MKTIILLLLPFVMVCQPLTKAMFKTIDGQTTASDKVDLTDASDNSVTVNFLFSAPKEQFAQTPLTDLNTMLLKANSEALFGVKNRFTYIPRKVTFVYSDKENRWLISLIYTAENDYGATKNGTATAVFTTDGILYDFYFI